VGRRLTPGQPARVDRVSPNDLTNLAVDHGRVPMNIAAVLMVEGGGALSFPDVGSMLGDRLPRVPRMRQRLVRAPVGCGRPYWVDDASFELDRQLQALELSGVHSLSKDPNASLLRVAAELVCRRLPHDGPLWRAAWVTGLDDESAALVLVVHHVLADGLGGLAVLGALADEGAEATGNPFPAPPPGRLQLGQDAWRERSRALRGIRGGLAGSVAGLRELGPAGHRPTLAPATSLNRPTGPRRRLTTVAVPLDEVLDLAHTRRCTVNDVVLSAIVGAMAGTLRLRGERPTELVVSVPISSRADTTAEQLGNQTGVVPMSLPTSPDPHHRLARVAEISRERRRGPRGASAGPMGLAFRALGRLGLFQPFINRQRIVNTFITNVRGPAAPLSLGGHRVSAVIPVAVNPGNVGVSFDVLSYAGHLGVTVVADPDVVPDQDQLTRMVSDELVTLLSTAR
jgi:WS/DGAT/MGAT family acyltransferase